MERTQLTLRVNTDQRLTPLSESFIITQREHLSNIQHLSDAPRFSSAARSSEPVIRHGPLKCTKERVFCPPEPTTGRPCEPLERHQLGLPCLLVSCVQMYVTLTHKSSLRPHWAPGATGPLRTLHPEVEPNPAGLTRGRHLRPVRMALSGRGTCVSN